MEHLLLPHLEHSPITLGLFIEVKNAAFLRQQLMEGNTAYEYAFLDASILASKTQVLVACFRAIHDAKTGRMKSRNVHSEIVFSLSSNNNIAESFRRFGVSDTTTALVAIKVGSDVKEVERHLLSAIDGQLEILSDEGLARVRSEGSLRKIYHVDTPAVGEPLPWRSQAVVLGNMALRGS